jgi:hypothetical protein
MNEVQVSQDEMTMRFGQKMYSFVRSDDYDGDHKHRCDRCDLHCSKYSISFRVRKCNRGVRQDELSGCWKLLGEFVEFVPVKPKKVDNRSEEERLLAQILLG